jgi:hypothetical protein
MSTASSIAGRSTAVTGQRLVAAMASRPLAIALAIVALLTAFRVTGTVDSDVAWQLWIAGRIHAGAHLYRDIIEVNPPLWFWMALPVDSIASALHVRIEAVLTIAVGMAAALALAATDRLLPNLTPRRRTFLLSYVALVLMGLPWVHIGQREQIALIGTLPYAALIAVRRDDRPVPPLTAALVGTGAALGFALKHYFLIVPLALELWLIAGQGRAWRWRRPETLAILAVGLAYASAILLLAREYVTNVVPLVRLSYGQLGAPSLRYLFGPFAIAGFAVFATALAHAGHMRKREASLAAALLVAAAAFGGVYFIQSKGWIYHAIPLLGCSTLALAALLAETSAPMRVLRLTAPALLALPLFLTAEEALHPALPGPDVQASISGLRPGDSVGFLAVETAVPWSVTLQRGFRYPSRYMGFWMLNSIVHNERVGAPNPRLSALGRQIVDETVTDFACAPPRRIIVARPRPGDPGFDILPFFLRDPGFAALLSHYRATSRTSVETYEMASPLVPPATGCRTGI